MCFSQSVWLKLEKDTKSMKAIPLLAALLAFALPVKAEEDSNLDGQKAYLFGTYLS